MRLRSLLTQVLLVNILLIGASVAAATVAIGGGGISRGREGLVALLAVTGTLLGNWLLLRRRFEPLDRVLSAMEQIDLRNPNAGVLGEPGFTSEVRRLDAGLRRLIERLETERRQAGQAVVSAQERERRRIARDLHDEVNQALTAVSLRLQATLERAPEELRGELDETKRLVSQAMRELLALARQLRPSVLDDHGLVPALRTQVRDFGEQTGLSASFRLEGAPRELSPEQDLVLYRVTQESLSNVAQHAEATGVEVRLSFNGQTHLHIRDDGCGFDPAAPRPTADGGLGVSGMRERALLAGGWLRIDSAPGRGTCVELTFD